MSLRAAALDDPLAIRSAGRDLLSLALIDARNLGLRWLEVFERRGQDGNAGGGSSASKLDGRLRCQQLACRRNGSSDVENTALVDRRARQYKPSRDVRLVLRIIEPRVRSPTARSDEHASFAHRNRLAGIGAVCFRSSNRPIRLQLTGKCTLLR